MTHRESNSMLDSRNQCLQLVLHLKWGLGHKLVCRAPFEQNEILLFRTKTNKTSILYYTREMKSRSRKDTERNQVTSVLGSLFVPLQKLSEVSALSTDPLKIEVKGTIYLALYTENWTLRTQLALPHSFSTLFLIGKVSKHITVSAAFQGHKGDYKHKSLPPPIPNPPPSKSNLAVLHRLQYIIHLSKNHGLKLPDVVPMHIIACIGEGYNIHQRQRQTCLYLFEGGLKSNLDTLKNFIYPMDKRFLASF